MTTINALNAVGNLQKYENTSATSAPSFSGAAERYSIDEQRSKSSDYLKIGLAMAAAAGVGFLIRKPKAAQAAAEAVSDVANAAGRAAGKAAGKAADDLTSVYKLLAGVKIKVAKGQKLIKNGNFVQIVDKKSGRILKAVTLNTNGNNVSKIATFEYDKAGKLVKKVIQNAEGKVIGDLYTMQLTKGVNAKALSSLINDGASKNSVTKAARKFVKANGKLVENIKKHNISKEVVQRILTEKGVTEANANRILKELYKA